MIAAVTKYNDVSPLTLAAQVADVTIPHSLQHIEYNYTPGHTYIDREMPNTMMAAVTKHKDVNPLTLAVKVADVTIPNSLWQHRL